MSHTTRLFLQSLVMVIAFVAVAYWFGAAPLSRLLYAALVLLPLSWTAAAFATRRHARSLRELSSSARALAAGDLSIPPALSNPGELGEMSDALRRVAEQLGARIEALQSEDALLSALIESLNEGVFAVDAQQRVVRINRAGRELLRVGEERTPLALDALPREASLQRAIQDALRGSSTPPLEVTIGERQLALTATPLSEGGGVVALYDLTRLRRLEQIRRDFVANVSHELRTPLTVVSGFAETLAEDDPPTEQRRQFAEAIHTHTVRMQRIVDDLLDLSRMESGGWRPNPEQLLVRNVAEDTLAAERERAKKKGIELRIEIPDAVNELYADRTAVRQILTNLVENALRHTEKGQVVVFGTREPSGTVLGVRDTGSGIAPAHLPRVFERFYRADPGRSRESGGTGLGLSIVKHLAEAHGGSARIESEQGRGTVVSVFLPRPGENPPL
jgi:two-component system, OmpR family, phosphate regulon sensor histidine kinase PhoR